jgi:hypothetical protein
MGVLYAQASFKNSRIASRKATTNSYTTKVSVPVGITNTLLIAANLNRTYLTVRVASSDPLDQIRYGYSDLPTLNVDGMLLRGGEGADLEAPNPLYARNLGANPILLLFDIGEG